MLVHSLILTLVVGIGCGSLSARTYAQLLKEASELDYTGMIRTLNGGPLEGDNNILPDLFVAIATKSLFSIESDRSWVLIVDTLIKEGVPYKKEDEQGRTLVHLAAKYGLTCMLLLLLQKGLDANHCDSAGDTPLHMLRFYHPRQERYKGQFEEVVTILVEYGADPCIVNNAGEMPGMVIHPGFYKYFSECVAVATAKVQT